MTVLNRIQSAVRKESRVWLVAILVIVVILGVQAWLA